MSRLRLVAVTTALLCFFLLLKAPARLLGAVLPEGQLVMTGYSGTLWQGSASRVLIHTEGGDLHLGRLEWSLQPLSLLVFAPTLEFHSQWAQQTLSGEIEINGPESFFLQDFEARLPASLIQQIAPLELDGTLSILLESLSVEDRRLHAVEGRLLWQHAVWDSPRGKIPLGSYAVDLVQLEGEALEGNIVTIDGPVNAAGTVYLERAEYALDALVTSETELDAQLQQALSLLAEQTSEGFRMKFSGQL